MNRNKIILFFASLSTVFLIASCDEKDLVYEGEALIEFSIATYTNLTKVSKQSEITKDTVVVQLLSPQQKEDLAFTYTIDATSTAVEGVHYTIVNKGSYVIPANKSFGKIALEVLPGIDPANTTETRTIIFILQGNNTVNVSENYKKLTYTIKI